MDPEMLQKPKPFSIITSPVTPSTTTSTLFSISQLNLRIIAFSCALAGAITMITSREAVSVYGIQMDARYQYSAAFRFKLIADFFVCGLSAASILLSVSLCHPTANQNSYFHLLMLELVSLLLLLSGCSAATAIGYVGKFGQDQSGWIAICDHVHKFCNRILLSIACSYVAVVCLLILVVMAAFKLKTAMNLQRV